MRGKRREGAPVLNIGLGELLVVGVLVLVFVGPDRLPELMRFLGKHYGRLRRASDDLRRAFQMEVDKQDADRRAEEIRRRREELLARRRLEAEAMRKGTEQDTPTEEIPGEPREPESHVAAARKVLEQVAEAGPVARQGPVVLPKPPVEEPEPVADGAKA